MMKKINKHEKGTVRGAGLVKIYYKNLEVTKFMHTSFYGTRQNVKMTL